MTDIDTPPEVLRAPLQTYSHPETKSVVMLFGMIHVGRPEFYHKVGTLLDETAQRGHVTHLEGVRKATQEELEAQSFLVRKKVRHLARIASGIYPWFKGTGLISQKEGLERRPTWITYDAPDIEVARRISLRTLATMSMLMTTIDTFMDMLEPDQRTEFALKMVHGLVENGTQFHQTSFRRRLLLGDMTSSVLGYRNGVALAGLDHELAYDPETNLNLVWGAAHLPGLGEGLKQRGYQQTDEQLLDVITLAD